MYKKALAILIATTLSFALLTGCGNKAEEALGEIEGVQELADASTPEPTTEPTSTPVVKETPSPISSPSAALETKEQNEVKNTGQTSETSTTPESETSATNSTSTTGLTSSTGSIDWDSLTPEEQEALLPVRQEIENLFMAANAGSGNNNSSGSTSSSSGGTSSSGSTGSNTGSTTPSTGNTGSTGSTTPPSASSNPASEQPAQHSHNVIFVFPPKKRSGDFSPDLSKTLILCGFLCSYV